MTTPQLFSWEETQELAKKNKLWRYCVEGCLKQNVFWALVAIPVLYIFYLFKFIRMSRKMIRYKRITELESKLIEQIIKDIFGNVEIKNIIYDEERSEVRVWVTTRWHTATGAIIVKESKITLTDPFIFEGLENNDIFTEIYDDDMKKYKQFCLANGVCEYLKGNKYLIK